MLQPRPPVITIMGHVDHGKTTLLDFIRSTKVAAREAGGITQHIGAYNIEHKGKPLTFIDTPGHAAFTKMRERGSKITDIVVLVVAANDGVKPQTLESIRHIQNAKVPVIVAINKIDLPSIDPNIAKSQLAEHGLLVTEYGGDIETVELSALTGKGVDTLLETLAAMADLLELKADPEAPLEAVVIESSKDKSKGSVATVIVQKGTLAPRQDIYTEEASGRVRALTDELGKQMPTTKPGFPAEIIGFTEVPAVGAIVKDANKEYEDLDQVQDDSGAENPFAPGLSFNDMFNEQPKLKLIIKADVQGTLEAIVNTLDSDSTELITSGVGEVTELDIDLAEASGARIISFHMKVSNKIQRLAKDRGVKIKSYDIIYHLIEDLQKQMLKLLEPTIDEVVIGEAEILQIFEMKGDRIAGVRVKTGAIKKHDLLHLKRNDQIIANPVIKSMMHGKQEIIEINAKNEGGMTFKNRKLDFEVGDIIIAYRVED